jgi:hypothetical protein
MNKSFSRNPACPKILFVNQSQSVENNPPRVCFDLSLADFPIKTVSTGRIYDLLRVSHAPHRIEEYQTAMMRGDRFPPISVISILGRFVITDGHKRFSALQKLKVSEIPVECWNAARLFKHLTVQTHRQVQEIFSLIRGIIRREPGTGMRVRRYIKSVLVHWSRIVRSPFQRSGL